MRFYFLYSLSILRSEPLKAFLSLLGIVLGVAVYGAVRLANERVIHDFDFTARQLAGEGEYYITSAEGRVREELYRNIIAIEGLRSVSPRALRVVQLKAKDEELGTFYVLGLDLVGSNLGAATDQSAETSFSPLKYQAVFVSEETLDELQGRPITFQFDGISWSPLKLLSLPQTGIADAFGGRIIVVDISLFQEIFNSFGWVDGFDIQLDSSASDVDQIRSKFPAGIHFTQPGDRKLEFEKMTEAFRLNLSFLAGISLLVAVLLIYNTTSYLALKRRKDFGVLLSIGVSKLNLFRYLLLEAAFFGICGALLGVALAWVLARYTTAAASETVSALYVSTLTHSNSLSTVLFFELCLLGTCVAMAGAALPAGEVFSAKIRETFHYQSFEQKFRSFIWGFAAAGSVALLLAYIFAHQQFLKLSLWFGFVPPLFLCAAAIFLAPAFVQLSTRVLALGAEKVMGIEALLALDHLRITLRRTVVVVTSIALSLGMFLGVTTMIASFRGTVAQWLEHVIVADVFISLPSSYSNRSTASLPRDFVSQVENHESVAFINTTTATQVKVNGRPVLVRAEDFSVLEKTGAIFLRETPTQEDLSQLFDSDAVLVSEAFESKFGKGKGDEISIPLTGGTLRGRISGVFLDYVSEHGVVLVDRSRFVQLTGLVEPQGLSVYLKDGFRSGELLEVFASFDQARKYIIRDSEHLRQEVFRVFDATFQITYALQAISLLISFFVLLNALLMLFLEREREFMSFRVIGASFFSLVRMVSFEALFLSLLSAVWGMILGICLSLLLVFVVNRHFFGWSVRLNLDWGVVASTMSLVLCLSVVLSALLSVRSLRHVDAKVLRYE